jgi:hypothetical protein
MRLRKGDKQETDVFDLNCLAYNPEIKARHGCFAEEIRAGFTLPQMNFFSE